jgi:hypothetical protein
VVKRSSLKVLDALLALGGGWAHEPIWLNRTTVLARLLGSSQSAPSQVTGGEMLHGELVASTRVQGLSASMFDQNKGFWRRTRPGFYQDEEPSTVPQLLPGTGPRRCPCSRPCARRRHRSLAGVSRFWRPFSDAATKREPLVSRAAGGVLHALTTAYRHPRVASDDVRTVWRNLANETTAQIGQFT